jgi:hypothetical protein
MTEVAPAAESVQSGKTAEASGEEQANGISHPLQNQWVLWFDNRKFSKPFKDYHGAWNVRIVVF